MRILVRLLLAFIFFSLFAFSLNNQQPAALNWFFGLAWQAPMVFIVLAAFGAGTVFGVLAMTPSWWSQRRLAQQHRARALAATPPSAGNTSSATDRTTPPLTDGI